MPSLQKATTCVTRVALLSVSNFQLTLRVLGSSLFLICSELFFIGGGFQDAGDNHLLWPDVSGAGRGDHCGLKGGLGNELGKRIDAQPGKGNARQ
jgi:hypothetical protein